MGRREGQKREREGGVGREGERKRNEDRPFPNYYRYIRF